MCRLKFPFRRHNVTPLFLQVTIDDLSPTHIKTLGIRQVVRFKAVNYLKIIY